MDEKDNTKIEAEVIKKGVEFVQKHPKLTLIGAIAAMEKVIEPTLKKLSEQIKAEKQQWREDHPGIAYRGEKVEAISDVNLPNWESIRKGTILTVLGHNDDCTEYMFDMLVEIYDDGLVGMGYIGPFFSCLSRGKYQKQYYPTYYFKIKSKDNTEDNSLTTK